MSTSDGSTRKHSHYHKDVGHLLTMDVYRLCERFEINDPSGATQHAIKKLVCAGQRGSKGLLQDLQEAVDTINRRIEMIYEDQARDALLSAAFGQQNMIDPEDVEISEKQACSVSADEHADMLARFDKRRAELLCRGSCESNVTVLPDGSAFGVMSFPLSKDHWLYADRAYEDGADQQKELPAPILNHGSRETVVAAARYAVRGATNCGKDPDFDPDALVQNVVYALCGPYGRAEPIPVDPADVEIASAIDDDSERMQAIGQNGEMAAEVYAAVDGWVLWNGGECPVMDGTLIDTRHRDGELWLGSVCGQYGTRTAPMFWTHTGDKAEVIAYRLHAK